jgi:hypothetical protein|tara:strand:+ start:1609 stop:2112 length:504 start_codon:yes stop_codon:yes gene_type:complete
MEGKMAQSFRAGEGYGGWIQVAPDSWQWDPSITHKQTEKDWYLHWPKGQKFKETEVSNVDPFSSEEIVKDLNAMEDKKAKKAQRAEGKKSTSRLSSEKQIVYVKHPEKGPRQMVILLDKLKEFEGGIRLDLFWDKLEGELPTKQSVERVYKHYHREMVDKGYIRILS